MRHWLQAEQELAQSRGSASSGAGSSPASAPSRNSDVNPLQGTRAAAAASASRDPKRAVSSPVTSSEKNGNGAQAPRRKPASAPAL